MQCNLHDDPLLTPTNGAVAVIAPEARWLTTAFVELHHDVQMCKSTYTCITDKYGLIHVIIVLIIHAQVLHTFTNVAADSAECTSMQI